MHEQTVMYLFLCVCACLIIMHSVQTGQLSPIIFPSALGSIKTALPSVHNNATILCVLSLSRPIRHGCTFFFYLTETFLFVCACVCASVYQQYCLWTCRQANYQSMPTRKTRTGRKDVEVAADVPLPLPPYTTLYTHTHTHAHTPLLPLSGRGRRDQLYLVPTPLEPGQSHWTLWIVFWCGPLWLVGPTV